MDSFLIGVVVLVGFVIVLLLKTAVVVMSLSASANIAPPLKRGFTS